MKRKLAIAKALMNRPQLLIFDEPTAGLDPVAATGLYDEFFEIAALEGVTVFLTTHKIAEVEHLCTMVGLIRQGRLLAVESDRRTADFGRRAHAGDHRQRLHRKHDRVAPPSAREVSGIQAQHGRLLVELADNTTRTWPLVNLLVESGADIEEVRKGQLGLESIFLHMVEDDAAEVEKNIDKVGKNGAD